MSSAHDGAALDRKQSLAGMLARARAKITEGPRPRQDRNNVPLSHSQNTLWFVDRLQTGGTTYNVAFLFRLEGDLDVAALTDSFASIVMRHEALRTHVLVENDEYFQGVVENPAIVVERTSAESAAEAERLMAELAGTVLDLTAFPLWRASLVTVGDDLHYFGFLVHHIVFDGVSTSIFFEELEQEYNARRVGAEPKVEPPTVQFADFSAWQRKRMAAGAWQESVDHWAGALRGVDVMDIPGDRPLPPEATYSRRRRGDHLGGPGGPGQRARLRAVDHADHRLRHGDGRALQQILGGRGRHLRSADGQPHRSRMRKDDRLLHQHAAAAVPGGSRGDVPGMSRGCPAAVPGRPGARPSAAGGDYRRGRCAA